jgi:predicted DNA-binding transcriptional regulator YafY
VDALEGVVLLNQAAREISVAELDADFGSNYGIYGGATTQVAKLRFSQAATRWVADEEWHPEQVGQLDASGCYVLQSPYADATELSMDILRHGHHVEVLEPAELRDSVKAEVSRMAAAYLV